VQETMLQTPFEDGVQETMLQTTIRRSA